MGSADTSDIQANDIEARLDALQRESQERKAALRELATDLPQATSRRAYLSAMARGVVDAPDKGTVAKRVALKVLRLPADAVRAVRTRAITRGG